MAYDGKALPHFNKVVSKIKDRKTRDIARDAAAKVIADPAREGFALKGRQWAGVWRARSGKYRMFYTICRECRRTSQQPVGALGCANCVEIPDATVVLVDFEIRGNAYDGALPSRREAVEIDETFYG